jgi:F-type H+-transporting ATPase subunit b
MFAFVTNLLLFAAETAHSASGGSAWESFKHTYNEWFNIPGFEAWKFLNLAIFIALMIWFSKKLGLPDSYKTKREQIRAELIKAEAEKNAALGKLTSAEAKLAQLESEKEAILQKAKDEAAFEKKRLAEQTKVEAERMRQQSAAELSRLSGQTRAELRRYSAEESIRIAEEKLRTQIDGAADARLVKASIGEIGGLN